MKIKIVLLGVFLFCFIAFASADILEVPSELYTSIQGAIDAAADGDIVLVNPGSYDENIYLGVKKISVISRGGRENTQIKSVSFSKDSPRLTQMIIGFKIKDSVNCEGSQYIINNEISKLKINSKEAKVECNKIIGDKSYFINSWGEQQPINGITIFNYYKYGQICPEIKGNIIEGFSGYGISVRGRGSDPYAYRDYSMYRSDPLITNNIIRDNVMGGINCVFYSEPKIFNNTIVENDVGVSVQGSNGPKIKNNLIADNRIGIESPQGDIWDTTSVTYNDFFNNESDIQNINNSYIGAGNIFADPYFVDSVNEDYHLLPLSPCIDAGDPDSDYSLEPEPNGGRIDMGAYGNTSEAFSAGMPINNAPVANSQSVTVDENMAKVITLTGSDEDNSSLGYEIISQPLRGTLRGTALVLTYMPQRDYIGPDSFTFRVRDAGNLISDTATVSITVRNLPPPAPRNLRGRVINSSMRLKRIRLDWDGVTDSRLAGYNVYVRDNTNINKWIKLNNNPIPARYYTTTLNVTGIFYFKVKAVDNTGLLGADSNIASIIVR